MMEVPAYEIIKPAISSAGVYYFTTDSGVEYEVRFGRKKSNILHSTIVFGVRNEEYDGEEYAMTNRGELYRVMTTISEIVKIYIALHPNTILYEFTGITRDDEDEDKEDPKESARIKLYKRYLPRIFEGNHWDFDYSRGNTVIVSLMKS